MDRRRMFNRPLLVLFTAATLHAQPTFHTAVDLVTVPVAVVTPNGDRVGDLGAGDFRIYEDGVLQDVALVTREPRPLSLCILLDSSPSMAGREALATRAIDTILKALDDDDEVALLMFASKVRVAVPWTRVRDTRTVSWYGWRLALGTALIDAMKQSLTLVETAHNPMPVVVIVSDGGEMSSGTSMAKLVSSRRQSETIVYGIRTPLRPSKTPTPLSRNIVVDFLPELVGDSGGRVYLADHPQAAEAAGLALIEELRSLYTLGYAPKKPMDGRYRHLKIEPTNRALVVRHRDGYLAEPRR